MYGLMLCYESWNSPLPPWHHLVILSIPLDIQPYWLHLPRSGHFRRHSRGDEQWAWWWKLDDPVNSSLWVLRKIRRVLQAIWKQKVVSDPANAPRRLIEIWKFWVIRLHTARTRAWSTEELSHNLLQFSVIGKRAATPKSMYIIKN